MESSNCFLWKLHHMRGNWDVVSSLVRHRGKEEKVKAHSGGMSHRRPSPHRAGIPNACTLSVRLSQKKTHLIPTPEGLWGELPPNWAQQQVHPSQGFVAQIHITWLSKENPSNYGVRCRLPDANVNLWRNTLWFCISKKGGHKCITVNEHTPGNKTARMKISMNNRWQKQTQKYFR